MILFGMMVYGIIVGHGRKGEDVACNQENVYNYMSSRSAVL